MKKNNLFLLLAGILLVMVSCNSKVKRAEKNADQIRERSSKLSSTVSLINSIVAQYDSISFFEIKPAAGTIFVDEKSTLGRYLDTAKNDIESCDIGRYYDETDWGNLKGKVIFYACHDNSSFILNNESQVFRYKKETDDFVGNYFSEYNLRFSEFILTNQLLEFLSDRDKLVRYFTDAAETRTGLFGDKSEEALKTIEKEFDRIEKARYFAVISFDYLINPASGNFFFTRGNVRATIDFYDLNTGSMQPVHSRKVFASSSSSVSSDLNEDLMNNLTKSIKSATIDFLKNN